jgi:hypothetical protein
MRKKLLALLMCATMVLGSSAVASAATITQDDITNAQTVINQYTKGDVDDEYDAKTSKVTFSVTYKNGDTTAFYNYGIVDTGKDDKSTDTVVKTDKDGNALTQVTSESVIGGIDDVNKVVYFVSTGKYTAGKATQSTTDKAVTNPSQTVENLSASAASVIGSTSNYYVEGSWGLAGTALAANQYAVVTQAQFEQIKTADYPYTAFDAAGNLTASRGVVTLTKYTAGETAIATTKQTTDAYGVDPDGYIALKSGAKVVELSSKVADGYWVNVYKATASINEVAQALADSEITAKAVAVQIDFYELQSNKDSDTSTETGFMKLKKIDTSKTNADVTFKADWLSRSNAKNANKVYVINPNYDKDKIAQYLYKIGSVYEVSDLADDTFTTNYIVSGTYIFDTVEDASQNDGVNDEATTTAATTASTTAATSPKTGDVAPIAALAVVMMGACGAMVVASKKRA